MTKRILVPIDPAHDAHPVMSVVGAVAREAGATVRLLCVSPIPEPRLGPFDRVIASTDQMMARVHDSALESLQTIETDLEGVPVEKVVRFGDAADEILLEAECFGADLIALGAVPSRQLARPLVRGVARAVVMRSPVPCCSSASRLLKNQPGCSKRSRCEAAPTKQMGLFQQPGVTLAAR